MAIQRQKRALRVGEMVRCERAESARGTWPRYAGRVGWVAVIRRERFTSGRLYVEVGVSWAPNAERHGQADSWFLLSELVVVGHRPSAADRSDECRVDVAEMLPGHPSAHGSVRRLSPPAERK
jgi:hypothetical protein